MNKCKWFYGIRLCAHWCRDLTLFGTIRVPRKWSRRKVEDHIMENLVVMTRSSGPVYHLRASPNPKVLFETFGREFDHDKL